MESWIMDLRYAVRRLRSRPTYALLAVLTLALGVGGTAAIFGIVRGLLLEPLPYAHEEEVAVFWKPFDWTEEEILFLRPEIPGFRRRGRVPARGRDAASRSDGPARAASRDFRVRRSCSRCWARGRRSAAPSSAGDDRQGADPVAVLSHGLWQEMGGDASIIGRRVQLDGIPRTVVGVMPRGFWFPDPTVRVWLPEPLDPDGRRAATTRSSAARAGAAVSEGDGTASALGPHHPSSSASASTIPSSGTRRRTPRSDAASASRWSARCGRRCSRRSPRWRSSCSSPAPTSPR